MAGSCTCGVISVGNRGPDLSLPRNLDPDCPEHGDAATMARFDAMDPVRAIRDCTDTQERLRVVVGMLDTEARRAGPPRKRRIADIVTALRAVRHIDHLDQLAREKAARRG